MNIGIPESYAIVGSLGVRKDSETCRKCRRQGHLGFECPKRLAELFGEACPGFDTAGDKDAASSVWNSDELTVEGKRQMARLHRNPWSAGLADGPDHGELLVTSPAGGRPRTGPCATR